LPPQEHRAEDDAERAERLQAPQHGDEQMGRYAITAHDVGWSDELTAALRPDTEPFATWLAEHRTVDMDVGAVRLDWTRRNPSE
jgi:hypothetical protein